MKILALSDIFWLATSVSDLISIVNQKRPDLILLAGDLVNDQIYVINDKVVHKDICWDFVIDFFEFCEKEKIRVFYIRGNWDYGKAFEKVSKIKFKYVKDISEKVETFRGMKILGLSYEFTNSLKELKLLTKIFNEKIDIVLAHTEYKRRIWLFHLNCNLIITGHYDRQVCQVKDKLFISLDQFPREYTFIYHQSTRLSIEYFDQGNRKSVLRKAVFSKNKLTWKSNRFRTHRAFSNRIEKMMELRARFIEDTSRKNDLRKALLQYGIPVKHVEEYITL